MLPSKFRLQIQNNLAASMTAKLHLVPWKLGADNKPVYGDKQVLLTGAAVGSLGGVATSSAIDNVAGEWLGVHVWVELTPGGSTTGVVTLFMQSSTDSGASEWPSDGRGRSIGFASWNNTSAVQSIDGEA